MYCYVLYVWLLKYKTVVSLINDFITVEQLDPGNKIFRLLEMDNQKMMMLLDMYVWLYICMYIISLIIMAVVEFLIKCLKVAKLKFQLASLRSFMRTPAQVTQAKKTHRSWTVLSHFGKFFVVGWIFNFQVGINSRINRTWVCYYMYIESNVRITVLFDASQVNISKNLACNIFICL